MYVMQDVMIEEEERPWWFSACIKPWILRTEEKTAISRNTLHKEDCKILAFGL
jgi:hypothetical protein